MKQNKLRVKKSVEEKTVTITVQQPVRSNPTFEQSKTSATRQQEEFHYYVARRYSFDNNGGGYQGL